MVYNRPLAHKVLPNTGTQMQAMSVVASDTSASPIPWPNSGANGWSPQCYVNARLLVSKLHDQGGINTVA